MFQIFCSKALFQCRSVVEGLPMVEDAEEEMRRIHAEHQPSETEETV